MKPGAVISPERTAPPGSSWASSTRTDQPWSASTLAATSPLWPAPMTTASWLIAPTGYPARMPDYQGRREADIAAPPEACFAALTDYASMPQWQRALKRVRVLEHDEGSDVVEFEVDAKVRTFKYRLRCCYDEPHAVDSQYLQG